MAGTQCGLSQSLPESLFVQLSMQSSRIAKISKYYMRLTDPSITFKQTINMHNLFKNGRFRTQPLTCWPGGEEFSGGCTCSAIEGDKIGCWGTCCMLRGWLRMELCG